MLVTIHRARGWVDRIRRFRRHGPCRVPDGRRGGGTRHRWGGWSRRLGLIERSAIWVIHDAIIFVRGLEAEIGEYGCRSSNNDEYLRGKGTAL